MQPFSNAAWQEFVRKALVAQAAEQAQAPAVGMVSVVPGPLNLDTADAERGMESDDDPEPAGTPLGDNPYE